MATKAEQTYTTLNALTADGMPLADAVRKVAADTDKSEGAVRANYYNHRKKIGEVGTGERSSGRGSRSRSAAPYSVEDALAEATKLLERALGQIDGEVSAAKAEADAATKRYEELAARTAERKAELERKIAALK